LPYVGLLPEFLQFKRKSSLRVFQCLLKFLYRCRLAYGGRHDSIFWLSQPLNESVWIGVAVPAIAPAVGIDAHSKMEMRTSAKARITTEPDYLPLIQFVANLNPELTQMGVERLSPTVLQFDVAAKASGAGVPDNDLSSICGEDGHADGQTPVDSIVTGEPETGAVDFRAFAETLGKALVAIEWQSDFGVCHDFGS
jgi:hypothetical protein